MAANLNRLKDPGSIKTRPIGSGPYVLKETVAGGHFALERRDGCTRGAGGATTADPRQPKTVVLKVVTDENTRANLLSGGELLAAVPQVAGDARAAPGR